MTKKDAAIQVWGVARRLRDHAKGDDMIDFEVLFLLGIARELDPMNRRYVEDEVAWSIDDAPSVRVKLRNLIDHPSTPQPEREAALRAMQRMAVPS
jgi:hypothetical protein